MISLRRMCQLILTISLSCNVTGQKGEQKSSNGAEGSEKHIHDKNVPIGTVVGKKFFQSLFGKL